MLNLVVIRSPDIDASAAFFAELGMVFEKHAHGKGPQHHACEQGGVVFEIYPETEKSGGTSATRLGFSVEELDAVLSRLTARGATIMTPAADSPWGRRAVIQEPFGHKVELVQREKSAAVG